MTKRTLFATAVALAFASAGSPARAQYYFPYGMGAAGYGWGGWGGGGGNFISDTARGMGVYAAGAGVYNYQTAQANSINADTIMRYNQYLYESQVEGNRRNAASRAARARQRTENFEAAQKRLLENPDQGDIFRGDALNALVDYLSNPKLAKSYARPDDRINGKTIRAIPFFFARDAITICLDKLTDVKGWPLPLRDDAFQAERDAYIAAVKLVLAHDAAGTPRSSDVALVREEIKALHDKVLAEIPADRRSDQLISLNFVKGLAGVARMMEKPKFEKVLEDLDPAKQATLGELLSFMSTYSLRFGVASSPAQRAAYQELYPMLLAQKQKVSAVAVKEIDGDLKSAPIDLFKDVETKHLIPSPPPAGK